MVIPKKFGGVRITVNYKKLNQVNYKKLKQIRKLSQQPIPRVDQILDCLGSGRVFSLFDLVSSFHQIKAHNKDTVPLTAFAHPRASTSGSSCPRAAALHLGGSSR